MDKKYYNLTLFETLKSLLSCTVEIYITYKFIDLEYGWKKGSASFESLKKITKSEEWKTILKEGE